MTFVFKPTTLQDAILIQPKVFGDERGFFLESYKRSEFVKAGIVDIFQQDNHSKSAKGVLRGLHLQTKNSQSKLIRVTAGSIYDVILDVRKGSPTFGQWEGFALDATSKNMLYIPKGFAHGFLSLEDNTEFLYKCDEEYDQTNEVVIGYDDPALAIDRDTYKTQLGIENFIVSGKDKNQKISLEEYKNISF